MKRSLTRILMAILLAIITSVPVWAETLTGSCGTNVTYSLDTESGILTISGTGSTNNYSYSNHSPWYSNRHAIKQVLINEGITSIGDYAFEVCDNVVSVTFNSPIVSIGEGAFYSCSSLTSITLPNSLTTLGRDAFCGCKQLASINIPSSVDSIGGGAFADCVSLPVIDNVRYADTYAVCGIYNKDSPSTIYNIKEGTRIIGTYAFSEGSFATSVTIPNTVVKIDGNAFSCSYDLASITIGNSVTYIGDRAFENCGKLTSINIPKSVMDIGKNAFSGCRFMRENFVNNSSCTSENNWGAQIIDKTKDGLLISGTQIVGCDKQAKSVLIPDYITSIEYEAFAGCRELTTINIPNSVIYIGSSAFKGCTGLKSASIPNTITHICISTFESCTSLISLIIPNSVINIGSSAFKNCSSLTSIIIPASVKTIESYAFQSCTSLTKVQLSDGLTTIMTDAFDKCRKLESMTLPSSITTLGNYFISDCKDLYAPFPKIVKTNVSIVGTLHVPSGAAQWFRDNGWRATSIEEDIDMDFIVASGTFDNINWKISGNTLTFTSKSGTKSPMTSYYTKLTKIEDVSSADLANYKKYPWYEYRLKIKHVVISEDVASVGWGCLYGANNLESITTYTPQIRIGSDYSKCFLEIFGRSFDKTGRFMGAEQSAFYDLAVPKTLSKIVYKGSVFGISYFSGEEARRIRSSSDGYGEWLHYNEYHPTNPLEIFADNVTEFVYTHTMALKNTKLYLTYTGEVYHQIFKDLADLYSLTINTTGVSTMSGAFYSLFGSATNNQSMMYGGGGYYIPLNLKEVHLMEGVTTIPEKCFNNVTSLEKVYLPSTLRGVQNNAFRNCDGLTDIYVNAAMPPSAKDDSFDGVNVFLCTLHVPYDSKQYYSIAKGWKDFYTIDNDADIRLTIVKNIENAGQIIGSTSYMNGETTNITAVANGGYKFVEWTDEDGNRITNKSVLSVVASASCTYCAVFEPISNTGTVVCAATNNSITLNWERNTEVNYYKILLYTNPEMEDPVKEVIVDANGKIITKAANDNLKVNISELESSTYYHYRIVGYNTEDNILDVFVGSFETTEATAINDISEDNDDIIAIYNIRGERLHEMTRGINIIRTRKGTTKTILIK